MINLRERMLPTSAGVEPETSWSPVGRASNCSTEAGIFAEKIWVAIANAKATHIISSKIRVYAKCNDKSFKRYVNKHC